MLSFTIHRKFIKSHINKSKYAYYINKMNSPSTNPRATFDLSRKLIAHDPTFIHNLTDIKIKINEF